MRSCFFSTPLGVKAAADGRLLDFDFLYSEVVRPSVEAAGMDCRRLDEFSPGVVLQRTLFAALVSSDLVIADISTANPNVFYELGVRHALRRGRTLLISAGAAAPFDVGHLRVLVYRPDQHGRLTGQAAAEFGAALRATIEQSRRDTVDDSPVHLFFPDLEVALPPELQPSTGRRRRKAETMRGGFAERFAEAPAQAKGELAESEARMRAEPEPDPDEYINLMRRCGLASEWDRVVALGEAAPDQIARSPEVRRMVALALNRRRRPGDLDRAIADMERQIAEDGGDSETFGVLGLMYKNRHDAAKAEGDEAAASKDFADALRCYRRGFEANPKDIFTGRTLIALLLQRYSGAVQAELAEVIAQVRGVVRERLEAGGPDFWVLLIDLELALIERDWPSATAAAGLLARQAPSGWMLEIARREVGALKESVLGDADRGWLELVLAHLEPRGAAAEVPPDAR